MELDGRIESLVKLSSGTSAASTDPMDVESGQNPLLGESEMINRLQDEITTALDNLHSVNNEMEQVNTIGATRVGTGGMTPSKGRRMSSQDSCVCVCVCARARVYHASVRTQVAGASPTASTRMQLQRHREILAEYEAEFKKTRKKVLGQRESSDLLGSVRREIACVVAPGSAALLSLPCSFNLPMLPALWLSAAMLLLQLCALPARVL